MGVMEFFIALFLIGGVVFLVKKDEWKSNNRVSPPGYEHDWTKANVDIALHGKKYYHEQNLKGKYDKPKKK